MKQEYVEDEVLLLDRIVEFWRLAANQAGVGLERWKPASWSDDRGVTLDSENSETSYYITKGPGTYMLHIRSRAEIRPTAMFGNYVDAAKSISFNLGSELRWGLGWASLYNIWSDYVPWGIVVFDRGGGIARYSLGGSQSRFVETTWKGPQQSRLLPLTIDEMHAVMLKSPVPERRRGVPGFLRRGPRSN